MVNSIRGKRDAPPEKTRRTSLFEIISDPALEAPLVAGSWWLLFTRAFGNPVDWRILLSLCPAVWVIYLFDRLRDGSKHRGGPPRRKDFARRHPLILKSLLFLALLWAGSVGVFLQREIVIQTVVIGLLTLGYFLVLRWKPRSGRLPFKEILIGFCFSSAVGLPFGIPVDGTKLGALLVFGAMCSLNCLMISRAESRYDQDTDPSAWFSVPGRSFPFRTVLAFCFIFPLFLLTVGLPRVLAGSLLTSDLLLCLVFFKARGSAETAVQSLSDAALWLPGICGYFFAEFFC